MHSSWCSLIETLMRNCLNLLSAVRSLLGLKGTLARAEGSQKTWQHYSKFESSFTEHFGKPKGKLFLHSHFWFLRINLGVELWSWNKGLAYISRRTIKKIRNMIVVRIWIIFQTKIESWYSLYTYQIIMAIINMKMRRRRFSSRHEFEYESNSIEWARKARSYLEATSKFWWHCSIRFYW